MDLRLLKSKLPLSVAILLWILTFRSIASAEIFTSMVDIETVVKAENGSIELVQGYVDDGYAKLDKLKRYAADLAQFFRSEKSPNTDCATIGHFLAHIRPCAVYHICRFVRLRHLRAHLTHYQQLKANTSLNTEPLNLYLYVKRLIILQELVRKNHAEDVLHKISEHRENSRSRFPIEEDVVGASVALFRLQDTYNLETSQLADGRIPGTAVVSSMTAQDCLQLGKVATDEKDPYHAVLWFSEAERRSAKERPVTVDRTEVMAHLTHALFKTGNVERAWLMLNKLQAVEPERQDNREVQYYFAHLKLKGVRVASLNEVSLPPLRLERRLVFDSDWFRTYEVLCRGEWGLTERQKAQLFCFYKTNRPFLRLARLRAEIVHLRPRIVLFKDVVSDAEGSVFQEIAATRFIRAAVVKQTGDGETTEGRISKISWILDEESDVVNRLSKRVEDMADLSCSTAEYLQVSHYGIGGHYEPHFDFALDDSPTEERATYDEWGAGNRIATVLFYLTEPTAGGATVFSALNLTLYPSKNDAVFWHNLHKSGKGDINLRHAACPVLSGVKWVANKWLHEFGQEFLRPCGLDPEDYT